METAQELTYEMDIEEAALNVPMTLSQADDCGLRLAEIKADAEGILQNWKERRNALVNEECEARVMVREYGDMLTTARAAKLGINLDAHTAAKWLQYTTKDEWLSTLPHFGFALEMREKHQARIEEINAEILRIASAMEYLSEYLTGTTPSVIPTVTVDDLPFESATATATAISSERFQQILSKVDVIPAGEKYMSRDIDSILSDVHENFNSAKICICSAIASEIWESEELTDAEKEAFEQSLATLFETVAERLEEVNAVSQLPSLKQINAVYHRA